MSDISFSPLDGAMAQWLYLNLTSSSNLAQTYALLIYWVLYSCTMLEWFALKLPAYTVFLMHILHFLFLILIKKKYFIIASNQPRIYKMHCRTLIKRNHSEYLSAKSVTADNISNKKTNCVDCHFFWKKRKKKRRKIVSVLPNCPMSWLLQHWIYLSLALKLPMSLNAKTQPVNLALALI